MKQPVRKWFQKGDIRRFLQISPVFAGGFGFNQMEQPVPCNPVGVYTDVDALGLYGGLTDLTGGFRTETPYIVLCDPDGERIPDGEKFIMARGQIR